MGGGRRGEEEEKEEALKDIQRKKSKKKRTNTFNFRIGWRRVRVSRRGGDELKLGGVVPHSIEMSCRRLKLGGIGFTLKAAADN